MIRLLSIVMAVLAVSSVFAAASVYAASANGVPAIVSSTNDACAGPAAVAPQVNGKVCLKRHLLGLPCAPTPVILPVAAALPGSLQDMEAKMPVWQLHRAEPAGESLFRPPRALA